MKSDFFDLRTLREDFDIECKAGEGKDGNGNLPKCIWETYSAMANTEGGIIFLGVKELKNDSFDFVGVKDVNKVIRDLWNGLNNPEKVSVNLMLISPLFKYFGNILPIVNPIILSMIKMIKIFFAILEDGGKIENLKESA